MTTMFATWRRAEHLFGTRDYYGAARLLEDLLIAAPEAAASIGELLARSYFHSAQVGKAAAQARLILQRDPSNAYAAMLLARSLERGGQPEAAAAARRLHRALA